MANNCEDCFDRSVEIPVGPAGVNGATGAQGPQGPVGVAGTDGTSQLVTLYPTTGVTSTTMTPLHNVQNLVSSTGNPLFATIGDIVRIHVSTFLTLQGNNTNYWVSSIEMVVDGVVIPIPSFLGSYSPLNGAELIIDLVATSISPLEIMVDIRDAKYGNAFYLSGDYTFSQTAGTSSSLYSLSNTNVTYSGIDQSSNITFQINGYRDVFFGTPGGNPVLRLPVLKIERLKK
jgi:hypothetical protein